MSNFMTERRRSDLLICAFEIKTGPVLTACYPLGLDALHYESALKSVKSVAQRILEPVSLIFDSSTLGRIRSICLPREALEALGEMRPVNHDIPEAGKECAWTPSVRLDCDDEENEVLTSEQLRFDLCLSGATREAPVFVLQPYIGLNKALAQARVELLSNKLGKRVVCPFMREVLAPEKKGEVDHVQLGREDRAFAVCLPECSRELVLR